MSQNVTLSHADQIHIEYIKQMFLENKSQLEMSQALKLHRRTIYRKIQKWIKTQDFQTWLKHAWLVKLTKVPDATAFKGLTRLMAIHTAYELQHPPKPIDVSGYAFRWLTEKEWKEKLLSNTVHIQGKKHFIKAMQDLESSHVEDDGEKPVAAQTSS